MKPKQYEPDFTEFLRAQPWMPLIIWNPDALANHKIEYAIGSGGLECCLGTTPQNAPPPPLYVAPPEYIEKYKYLRSGSEKPLVGIVWAAGQADHNWADDGALRTLVKSQVAEIVRRVNNVQWTKLQFNEPSPFPEIKEVD